MLEKMVDLLFAGKTERRRLSWREQQTVAEFKKLLAEVARDRHAGLKFDIEQRSKEIARLDEEVAVLEFVDVWPCQHPRLLD